MSDLSDLADALEREPTVGEQFADVVQPLASGAVRGLTATAGLPGDLLKLAEIGSQYVSDFFGGGKVNFDIPYVTPPTSSELNKLVEEYAGNYLTKPSSSAGGRIAQKTMELAVPGGLLTKGTTALAKEAGRRAAYIGGGAGAAGQTTREVTDNQMLGDIVEGVAGVAGLPGMRRGFGSRQAEQILQEANRIDPNLVQARAREATARQQGMPIAAAETLDSQTATTRTGDILSQPEAAQRFGIDELRRSRIGTATSPSTVQSAVRRMIGRRYEPDAFVAKVRDTAKGILSRAANLRTNRTQEFFEKASKDRVENRDVANIVKKIDRALEDYGLGSDPVANSLKSIRKELTTKTGPKSADPLEGLETSVGYVDDAGTLYNIYRSFRDRMDLAPDNPSYLPDTKSGVVKPLLREIRELARLSSRNVQEGHRRYVQISQDVVNPLEKGPIGKLAKVDSPQGIFSFFGREADVGPKQFEVMAREISQADPNVFKEMSREWLHRSFERAATPTLGQAGGVNFRAGAKFDVAVRGARGSDQRQKFDMIMMNLADVNGVRSTRNEIHSGFSRLMDVLSRMGRLPEIGSPTAGRAEAFREAGMNVTGLVDINQNAVLRFVSDVVRKREFGKLADALGTKGGIDALIKLGKERPTSKRLGGILAGLVTSSDVFLDDENN